MRLLSLTLLAAVTAGLHCSSPSPAPTPEPAPIVWNINDLGSIGGRTPRVAGEPRLIDTPFGRAVEFDGVDDALFLEAHPLAGATEFTAEVIFRPDAGGAPEQRFLHLQEEGSKDRILVETRLTGDGRWFLDTYVKSGGVAHTLFAKEHEHPVGRWYHAALVVGGGTMRHYVDGVEEMSRPIAFAPQKAGRTSVGVRINEVHWFKGAVLKASFAPEALSPAEFLIVRSARPES
jgi:hypothetical protein